MSRPDTIRDGNGKVYKLCVFIVDGFRDDGTPYKLRLMRDNDNVTLSEDPDKNHFITAYVPREVLRPKT